MEPIQAEPGEVAVLAVIDHFVMGGAETLLTRFAAAAPGSGIRLSIACLEEIDGNPAAAPLYELGMPPVNLNLSGRPSLRSLRAMRRHISSVGPQIVHTHLGSSDMLAGLAARTLGIPAISTIHQAKWDPGAGLTRRFVKACATRVIAVSESARQEYLKHGWAREEQIVTVYNGVDTVAVPGQGAEVRRELGLEADDVVVGMVSALRPEKGHDIAVEVIRRLRPRFPRLRLLIAGQGDLRDQIAAQAADLDDAVVLTGIRHDVMRVFDAVDVCLQPSRADAFPTTVLEAMAASVPVIATEVGGIPEILANGRTGVLVSWPPNPTAFAGALERLLTSPMRRRELAHAARLEYEQRFTTGPWVAGTRAVYDSVLSQGRRARVRAGAARGSASLQRSRAS